MDDLGHLVVASADGDPDAFAALVRALQSDVWRFARHMVGEQSVDDVVQDAFVRMWRAAGSFRGDSRTSTWALAITRRACIESWRRRDRHLRAVEAARVDALASSGAEADHAPKVALEQVIDNLEPDRRSAFVLTQLLGYGYADAALVCACPVGTIRSRVARARRDLVRELDAQPGGARRSGSCDDNRE